MSSWIALLLLIGTNSALSLKSYQHVHQTVSSDIPGTVDLLKQRFWGNKQAYAEFLIEEKEIEVSVEAWSECRGPSALMDTKQYWSATSLAFNDSEVVASSKRRVLASHRAAFTRLLSRATKDQIMFELRDGSLVLDETSSIRGIPMSDKFRVIQRLRAFPGNEKEGACRIEGLVRLEFSEKGGFVPKSLIENSAISECKTHQKRMAQYAIRLLGV